MEKQENIVLVCEECVEKMYPDKCTFEVLKELCDEMRK